MWLAIKFSLILFKTLIVKNNRTALECVLYLIHIHLLHAENIIMKVLNFCAAWQYKLLNMTSKEECCGIVNSVLIFGHN